MKKTKVIIVGRTASGKDTLADKLVMNGFTKAKSYATRTKRSKQDDTHIFVTPAEAREITDKAAFTKIGEYEYFTTVAQLEEYDVHLFDPGGVYTALTHAPDFNFHIIYVQATSEINRKNNALNRADNKQKGELAYDKRNKSESKQFDEFERQLISGELESYYPNIKETMVYYNNYTESALNTFVEQYFLGIGSFFIPCLKVSHPVLFGYNKKQYNGKVYRHNKDNTLFHKLVFNTNAVAFNYDLYKAIRQFLIVLPAEYKPDFINMDINTINAIYQSIYGNWYHIMNTGPSVPRIIFYPL